MIRADRSRVVAPAVLVDPEGSGAKEREKARTSLDDHRAEGKDEREWKFEFDVYSRQGVKNALVDLFHGKCAYCETWYAASQPMDVEHWRPKGQIEDGDEALKPGYWWLAATWENLMPSCIDCNRRRNQKDAVTGKRVNLGKLDQFPLLDPTKRAREEGKEREEQPAIVNPCLHDPAEFFEFDGEAIIKPRAGADETTRRLARESIRVYALNRSGLVQSRREALRLAQLSVRIVQALVELQIAEPDLPDNIAIVVDELLSNELRSLERRCQADQPYALMMRQLVERELPHLIDVDRPRPA